MYADSSGELPASLAVVVAAAFVGAATQRLTTALSGGSRGEIGAATATLAGTGIGAIIGLVGDAISAGGAFGTECQ